MLILIGASASQSEGELPLYTDGVQNVTWQIVQGNVTFASNRIEFESGGVIRTEELHQITRYNTLEIEAEEVYTDAIVGVRIKNSAGTVVISDTYNLTQLRKSYYLDLSSVNVDSRVEIQVSSGASGIRGYVFTVKLKR